MTEYRIDRYGQVWADWEYQRIEGSPQKIARYYPDGQRITWEAMKVVPPNTTEEALKRLCYIYKEEFTTTWYSSTTTSTTTK